MHPLGVRPVLFSVAGHDVLAYGFFLGLACAAGWFLALDQARRRGIALERAMLCFAVTAACALAGAHAVWLLANPHASADLVSGRGLHAWGGFLGGLAGARLFGGAVASPSPARAKPDAGPPPESLAPLARVPVWSWAEACVPAVALGLAVARVGCFCQGCCYGTTTSLFAPLLDRHPATLYEAAGALALLVVVLRSRRRVLAFFAGYALLRFAVEFLRADPDRGALGPLSVPQVVALAVLACCAAVVVRDRARSAGRSQASRRPAS